MSTPLTEPHEWVQECEHQHLEVPEHQPSLDHCPKEHCEWSSTLHKLFQEQSVREGCHWHTTHICLSHPFFSFAPRDRHNFPLCWHEQQRNQPQPQEAMRVSMIASVTASVWRISLIVESLFGWSTPPTGLWSFVSAFLGHQEPWTKRCGSPLNPVQSSVWSWHRLQQHGHD